MDEVAHPTIDPRVPSLNGFPRTPREAHDMPKLMTNSETWSSTRLQFEKRLHQPIQLISDSILWKIEALNEEYFESNFFSLINVRVILYLYF